MEAWLCHMLIGPPGSGKSTLAQALRAKLPQGCVVSTDAVRLALYGHEAEQGTWSEIEAEVVRCITQAVAAGQSVIYDATNARRSWRAAFLQQLKPLGVAWVGWHLTTPLAVCQRWNQTRDRQVPTAVITSSYEALQRFPPLVEEGFLAVYGVDYHNPQGAVDHALGELQRIHEDSRRPDLRHP